MLAFDWQLIVVAACVAWAALFLARRGWRMMRPTHHGAAPGSCGGCGASGGCDQKSMIPRGPALVTLQGLPQSNYRERD